MFEIVSDFQDAVPVPFKGGSVAGNPYVLVGGTAIAAAVSAWLSNDGWSVGEYNNWMNQMNDTIKAWDQIGWNYPGTGPKACWRQHPAKRNDFKAFWARFSKHYAAHGQISGFYVSDSEEKPARALMAELAGWGAWLNKACNAEIGNPTPDPDPVPPGATDWGAIMKWGAIGLGAVVVLNVITSVRSAFPRQP
jgi:hypothetical protein